MNLLSLNPRDKEGNLITSFEDFIIRDNQYQEVKAWHGLAQYMGSFQKEGGVPLVPSVYSQSQGRVVVDDDNSLGAKLESPNKVTWILVSVVLAAILVIFLLIFIPVKLYKRHKKKVAVR